MRTWVSFSTILGVVPDEINAWNPDTAPQAMVINKNGNRLPENTGPVPSINLVTAGICKVGLTITIPIANATIVPIFKKVDK